MENLESISFRKLNENDKDLFIKLRLAYLNEEHNLDEVDRDQLIDNLKVYFENHIVKNDFIGVIGEYNGKTVSVAYLAISEKPPNPSFINGKIGTLLNVFTYPEYRKKGIAGEIVKKIINEAIKMDIKVIELKATEAGIKLYEKIGFKECGYKNMNLKI